MAVSDGSGEVLYRFVYDTYGELSDIKTDDGISLKNSEIASEKTKDYTVEELAHAAGFTYLYNGQYGVATDQNGLYYMRARYYNQDIKRFINRDIVSGDIGNSKSLNRYAYVQGNPVSLTDPFGLCPDSNSSVRLVRTFLCDTDWSTVGHTALDIVGIFWDGADLINVFWYAAEGNTEMAITSAVYALPGIGMASGRLMMWSDKLYKAGKTVYRASKLTQGCYGVIGGLTMAGAGIGNIYNSLKNGEKISFKDIALAVGGAAIAVFSGKTMVSDMRQMLGISNKVDRTIKVGNADISHEPVPSEKKILEASRNNRSTYGNESFTSGPISNKMASNTTSTSTAITSYYPPNNGAVSGSEHNMFLMPGDKIDRYGGLKGKYLSPTGTPIEMRALPYNNDLSEYRQFVVVKPFEVEASTIAPAYGKIGLGTQYRSSVSVGTLLKRGIIKEIGGA